MSTSVFPAYVGMSPNMARKINEKNRVPRIRGDEPDDQAMKVHNLRCSPHTWG